MQSFLDAIHFKKFLILDENLTQPKDSFFKRLSNFILALLRRYYYSFIDMNLHYVEDGYEILKSYKVPKEKIFVTYNSPDTEKLIIANKESLLFDPILPENKFRLIHVGRLVKWKRVDFIIKTIVRLQEQFDSIELVVIGDGPELQNLKNLAEELDVTDRIIFVGAIFDPVMLGKYYNCSKIYVLGGMGGLSLNEAMSFGKPIICSVCDGTEKALVKEGFNGLYFVNGELYSLIEKVEFLLSKPDLIKQFGCNSLEIIKNKINIDTVALNYIEAFKSVYKDGASI